MTRPWGCWIGKATRRRIPDWDLAELADWEPEDPEGEPLGLAMPEPEALDLDGVGSGGLGTEAPEA